MKNYVIVGCIIAFIGMINACSGVSETPPDPEFKPDALVALGEKSISVWELIGKSELDTLRETEEMRITLQYLQKKALTVPALSLYNITTDTLVHAPYFHIDAGNGIEFGVPLAEEKVYFQQDTLYLTHLAPGISIRHMEDVADFEYVFPFTGFDYSVEITLQNIFLRGTSTPLVIKEKVSKDNQKGIRRKLNSEFDINLSQGNYLQIQTQVTIAKNSVLFEPQDVHLLIKSLNIKLQKAVGYFPVPDIQLDSSNLKMNLDILSDLRNAFDMSNPKYYLLVQNKGFGLPAQVDNLTLRATDVTQSKRVNLTTTEKMFFTANKENVLRTDTFVFTPANSNLIEFLELPPHGNINYTGTIRFNPRGNTGEENVIYADGISQVDSYVEIPMVMKGSSLIYSDTLKNLDFSQKQFAVAQLTVASSTDIPFYLTLCQVEFYDANGKNLGSIGFNKSLTNEKALNAEVPSALMDNLVQASYGIATIRVQPSLDVLSIRQDAALKINYSVLGEMKNTNLQ